MGKFHIYQTDTGYRFDLKATNGQTIAASEVYETEAACRRGIASVRKNAPSAKLEDQTAGDPILTNPKFEVYTDRAGAFRFRLKARNGQIIAVSEGYSTKSACLSGLQRVRTNVEEEET